MDLVQGNSKKGKVIFVNGCPFSGKSYLISSLTEELPQIRVVNFELFCNQNNGYPLFYKYVAGLAARGETVVAESVDNYIGRRKHADPYDFSGCLNIGVSISQVYHYSYLDSYAEDFGWDNAWQRLGTFDLITARKRVRWPQGKLHIYTGENLREIKEVVKHYVLGN